MKKDIKSNMETLGGRLKSYESEYEREIEPEMHIIARIDGHKFSKFTKGFKKPFDGILSKAMELTTMDLVQEFNAYTGYTQSDEITLVIPSLMNKENHKGNNKDKWIHGYSGRVQKMSSLISGFTTMKFNLHLNKIFNDYKQSDYDQSYFDILYQKVGNAWFDCRVYGAPSNEEAFNSVLWRVRDAEKNSRSMFAQTYLSHKKLQNLTGLEQVELCKKETGKDWATIEDKYKYGILVKREYYMKECSVYNKDSGISGERNVEQVQRSRITSWAEHLVYSDDNVQLIMSKTKEK